MDGYLMPGTTVALFAEHPPAVSTMLNQTNADPPVRSTKVSCLLRKPVAGLISHEHCHHEFHRTWLKSTRYPGCELAKQHRSVEHTEQGPDRSLLIFQQHYL